MRKTMIVLALGLTALVAAACGGSGTTTDASGVPLESIDVLESPADGLESPSDMLESESPASS